jgi:hypothetical protein
LSPYRVRRGGRGGTRDDHAGQPIGLSFEGVVRASHGQAALDAALLEDMDQFMSQQFPAGRSRRPIGPATEEDVLPGGEGYGTHSSCEAVGLLVRVYPHGREVSTERSLYRGTTGWAERPAVSASTLDRMTDVRGQVPRPGQRSAMRAPAITRERGTLPSP